MVHYLQSLFSYFLQSTILPQSLVTPRLASQASQAAGGLARLSSAQWTWRWQLTGLSTRRLGGVLQGLEELDSRVVCKVLVVVIVDLDHRGIRTCTEAFHLCECEETVWRSLAVVDTQCVFASLHDSIAVAEHAGGLEMYQCHAPIVTFQLPKNLQLCRPGRGTCPRGPGCTLCRKWQLRIHAWAASRVSAQPRS